MALRVVVRALVAAALSVVVLLLICIGGVILQYPLRAAAWHCFHGSTATVGSFQLKLPLSWWPAEDAGNGQIVLQRAKIDTRLTFETSELLFTSVKNKKALTDADAIRAQGSISAELNKGKSEASAFPFVIASPVGKIYCVKDLSTREFSSLFCFPSGPRWNFVYLGTAKEEPEAEAILATLK